jgi:hypothetical protein
MKTFIFLLLAYWLIGYNSQSFAQMQAKPQTLQLSVEDAKKVVQDLLGKALVVSNSSDGTMQMPMPAAIAKYEGKLRNLPGGQKIMDELMKMMNQQFGEALQPITNSLNSVTKDLSQADVNQLTSGAENAVSGLLKTKMGADLAVSLKPLISKGIAQVPVKQQFDGMLAQYNQTVGKIFPINLDLDQIVTDQCINLVFDNLLAKFELKIRQTPALYNVTPATKAVFGYTNFSPKTVSKAEAKALKKAEKEKAKAEKEQLRVAEKARKQAEKEGKSVEEYMKDNNIAKPDNKIIANSTSTNTTSVVVPPVIPEPEVITVNSTETFKQRIKEAKTALSVKDYNKAIPIFQACLAYKPADAQAKADLRKAETDLNTQIKKENFARVLQNARTQREEGDLKQAIAFYQDALSYKIDEVKLKAELKQVETAYNAETKRIIEVQTQNYSNALTDAEMYLFFQNFTEANKLDLTADQKTLASNQIQPYSFKESFENKNLEWEFQTSANKGIIEHGEFFIEGLKKGVHIQSLAFEPVNNQNFTIATTLRNAAKENGFEYGLVFGKSETNTDRYFFGLSQKTKKDKLQNTFVFRKYKGEKGKSEDLFTVTNEVLTDLSATFVLKVVKENNQIKLFVNEIELTTLENITVFFGQEVGFQVEGKEKIAIADLTLTGFYKMAEPLNFSPVVANRRVLYKETFDTDKQIWKAPKEAGENLKVRTEGGKLLLKNYAAEEYLVVLPIQQLDTHDDFAIEATIKHRTEDSEEPYGLVFGGENIEMEKYFYFVLNSKPFAEYAFAGSQVVEEDFVPSAAIRTEHQAVNKLKIVKQGFSLFFYCNNIYLGNISGAKMGNTIGFKLRGNQEIEVDEIQIMGSRK